MAANEHRPRTETQVAVPFNAGEIDSSLDAGDKRLPTNSLERALMSLDILARRPAGMSNAELSRWLEIPPSTCSYILSRLEAYGYVKRSDTGRYHIGLKVVALAHSATQESPVHQVLEPILRALVDRTRLTAAIGVLRRGRVLLVANIASPEPLRVHFSLGAELAFDTTAIGRAIIASLPHHELLALIDRYGLSKASPRTRPSRSQLYQQLETVRKQGYAINNSLLGARAVATAIQDAQGNTCASLVATGAVTQTIWKRSRFVVDNLKATARELSSLALDWDQF